MDVDRSVPVTLERVRDLGGRDHDVARGCLDLLIADREDHGALLHDEGLLVRVLVQAYAAAGLVMTQEERDAGAVLVAVEGLRVLPTRKVADSDYSHSMVPGGLDV